MLKNSKITPVRESNKSSDSSQRPARVKAIILVAGVVAPARRGIPLVRRGKTPRGTAAARAFEERCYPRSGTYVCRGRLFNFFIKYLINSIYQNKIYLYLFGFRDVNLDELVERSWS